VPGAVSFALTADWQPISYSVIGLTSIRASDRRLVIASALEGTRQGHPRRTDRTVPAIFRQTTATSTTFSSGTVPDCVHMNRTIIVSDLATVSDFRGSRPNDLVGDTDDEVREARGDRFPKHLYHSIVHRRARCAHRGRSLAVDTLGAPHVGERSEKQLISAFVDKIGEVNSQLVTFNGNTFDLSVLRYRASLLLRTWRRMGRGGHQARLSFAMELRLLAALGRRGTGLA
jgi:hypothetical protein